MADTEVGAAVGAAATEVADTGAADTEAVAVAADMAVAAAGMVAAVADTVADMEGRHLRKEENPGCNSRMARGHRHG